MGDIDSVEFPFALTPATSPFRARLHSIGGNFSDSDDDFALPMPSPKPDIVGPPEGAPATPTVPRANGTRGNDICRATESPASSPGAASAPATTPKREEAKLDNRDFIQFQQVRSQKSDRWDNINRKELAWYDSFPVLVVPPSQHPTLPVTVPGDGWVRAYGPADGSATATNSNQRYVVIQYLPLCYKSHQKPTCEYEVVSGKRVERVIPYNTLMNSKRRPRELGPEDRWADTEVHYKNMKRKRKTSSLKSADWEATLGWAQMYLDRALELDRERSKLEEQRRREAEEEHRKFESERQEREKEKKLGSELELQNEEARRPRGGVLSEAGTGKGKDGGRCGNEGGREATKQASTAVVIVKNLKLAPGDWIFYWDQTKRVGTPEARRNARIVEIRTVDEAREQGLERLVLDSDDIVLDDWVIQKYNLQKDSNTGEKTRVLDRRGNEVRRYKLVPGKLEGVESRRKRLAHELIAGVRQAAKAYGAGDQLRKVRGFSDTEQEDEMDDEDASDEDEIRDLGDDKGVNRVADKSVAGNARKDDKKAVVENSSGHSVGGSPATKKRTRERADLEGVFCEEKGGKEEVGDALAASIASRDRGSGSRKPSSKKSRALTGDK